MADTASSIIKYNTLWTNCFEQTKMFRKKNFIIRVFQMTVKPTECIYRSMSLNGSPLDFGTKFKLVSLVAEVLHDPALKFSSLVSYHTPPRPGLLPSSNHQQVQTDPLSPRYHCAGYSHSWDAPTSLASPSS